MNETEKKLPSTEDVTQEWVNEYVALRDKLANFLTEFKKSAASVNLLCGPRPGGKSKDWLDGQDRGLRQGLHIAETIVEALLKDDAALALTSTGSEAAKK